MSFPLFALQAEEVLRPPPSLRPSEFAERYIYLSEQESTRSGRWSNKVFPYLTSIMDTAAEAMSTGKRGIVCMKSGQGGGSRCWINVWAWLKIYYPGPSLYLISKDEFAREFGRERFDHMNATCDPLKAIHISGWRSGELVHTKRYTTGKHALLGGRSTLNLETNPFRIVIIDEFDSLVDEIQGRGDPLANAEIRVDSYPGQTLIIAFAHPSTADRCTGLLWYGNSDRRRAFAPCFHCGEEFWLEWKHVQVHPHSGQHIEHARRDPTAYRYITPCCDEVLEDAHRYWMAERTTQRSTLPPEEAARKLWIGVHFSQLYMNNKPLAFLAEKYIDGLDRPSVMRVFVNKRLGDVYAEEVSRTTPEDWRACVVIPRSTNDPHSYNLGQVPPGVSFLTAGQDSRGTELHWAVWGWGHVVDKSEARRFCGWLVDYGVIERKKTERIFAEDLEPFSELLYERAFPRTDDSTDPVYVQHGYHDAGWCPTAAYGFCLGWVGRAYPSRGDPLDEPSARRRPPHRWGAPPTFKLRGVEVCEKQMKLVFLNTYVLKEDLFSMLPDAFERQEDGHPQMRISLPRDVGDDWLAQASSEFLTTIKGKKLWNHKGPNHWSDCNVQAYGAAINISPFLRNETRGELLERTQARSEREARRRAVRRTASYSRGRAHGYTKPRRIRRSY